MLDKLFVHRDPNYGWVFRLPVDVAMLLLMGEQIRLNAGEPQPHRPQVREFDDVLANLEVEMSNDTVVVTSETLFPNDDEWRERVLGPILYSFETNQMKPIYIPLSMPDGSGVDVEIVTFLLRWVNKIHTAVRTVTNTSLDVKIGEGQGFEGMFDDVTGGGVEDRMPVSESAMLGEVMTGVCGTIITELCEVWTQAG